MEHDRPNDQNSAEAASGQRDTGGTRLSASCWGVIMDASRPATFLMSLGNSGSVGQLCIVSSASIGSSRAWRPCSLGGPDGAEGPASSPVSLRGLSARQSKRLTLHGLGRLSLIWSSRFTHDASKAICHSRTAGPSEHGWPRPLNANCLYARQWANALRVRAFRGEVDPVRHRKRGTTRNEPRPRKGKRL